MNWLILVAVAVLSDSLRIFVDNYSSDVYFKGRFAVSQKLFYGIVFVIIGIIMLAFSGLDFASLNYTPIAMILLAGVLSAIAGIPYFKALELDDSTNIGIFTQLAPVLYLILGWFFLGDTFSPLQLIAFAIVLSAPLLIVLTTRKRSRKIKIRAVFFAFLYVLIAVIGNIIFVKADTGDELNFINKLAFVLVGKGIADATIILVNKKWRHRFFAVMKKSHHKVLRPLLSNCAIGFIKEFSYRGALVAAPAIALASAASDAVEPIAIFFLGLLLTLIWPKFGREKLDKKSIIVHLIATVLVVIGILLLQL